MPKIKITNKTTEMQTVVLDHKTVCVRGGRCYCDKNGVCGSLHFAPLERKTGLEPAVLHARELTNEKIFDVRPWVVVQKDASPEKKLANEKPKPVPEPAEEKSEDKKRSKRNRKA